MRQNDVICGWGQKTKNREGDGTSSDVADITEDDRMTEWPFLETKFRNNCRTLLRWLVNACDVHILYGLVPLPLPLPVAIEKVLPS